MNIAYIAHLMIACSGQVTGNLIDFIEEALFSLEMLVYENFKVQSNALFSVKWIIIGVTVGIILAAAATVYNKKYIGSFVRLLISRDCLDAARAQTLDELECSRLPGIRGAIKTGGTLSRWIRCAEEDEYYRLVEEERAAHIEKHKDEAHPPKFNAPLFKRDCGTMHFYVPEERREAIEKKFDERGSGWLTFAVVTVVTIILGILACYFIGDILTYVDGFITFMNGI